MEEVLGSETIFRLWDDPLTPERLARLAPHRESFRNIRLLAEDAEEHLARALSLKEDVYSIPSLLLGARMLDYAGMKYIYASGNGRLFQYAGQPSQPCRRAVLSGMGIERAQSRAHHGPDG